MNGVSLFANVGIGETYAADFGLNIKVANELLKDRADFYKFLYPEAYVVCGDIREAKIYEDILSKSIEFNCEFVLATPPCQGMSAAGRKDPNDERNLLIKYVVDLILQLKPKYALIENVSAMLKTAIKIHNNEVMISEYICDTLGQDYNINYRVVDAADYGTPQYRKRAIILISRKPLLWEFPDTQPHLTVRETIGDLPSLESGQYSEIPYHYAKKHNEHHIEIMRHTPEGKSAFDNCFYYPKRKDGKKISGFSTTYKRIEWDRPAPTITMCNGAISSQNNVHPGRRLEDGSYSDARVLTLKELFRLTGLPEAWSPPPKITENLIRHVIGECLPPRLLSCLLTTLPK